jgi:hypothetical protein
MRASFRESKIGLIASVNVGSLPSPDKTVIPAPGEGKEIIIVSIASTTTCSLGVGDAGSNTFYYATAGSVSFPFGFSVGENKKVSCSGSPFLSISYYINNI